MYRPRCNLSNWGILGPFILRIRYNRCMNKYAYLAGIIDGEGHIHKPLVKNGRGESRPYARIIVVNTDIKLIEWLKKNFGGSVATVKPKNPKHKVNYRWILQGKAAETVAKIIKPYLICKRDQITRII